MNTERVMILAATIVVLTFMALTCGTERRMCIATPHDAAGCIAALGGAQP